MRSVWRSRTREPFSQCVPSRIPRRWSAPRTRGGTLCCEWRMRLDSTPTWAWVLINAMKPLISTPPFKVPHPPLPAVLVCDKVLCVDCAPTPPFPIRSSKACGPGEQTYCHCIVWRGLFPEGGADHPRADLWSESSSLCVFVRRFSCVFVCLYVLCVFVCLCVSLSLSVCLSA